MADPYLQLTFDAKRRVALAARSVDLPPGALAWGLWEVWEDVWRRKDATVPPLVLAGCFGTDPRIPAAMVAFGFLVEVDGAHRLAEEDERRILLTHKQRVEAGKARAASGTRSAGGVLVGRSSDSPAAHQRDDQRPASGAPALNQRNDPPAASSQQPAGKKKPAGSAPADPPRAGWQALIDRLTATYTRLMPGAPKYAFGGRDAKALALMLDRGVAGEVVEAAWARALVHQGFPTVRGLPELEQHLNHFLGAAQGPRNGTGILTHETGLETPEQVAAALKRQEEWLGG